MYCPECKQEHNGKFCPECGTPLIEKPVMEGIPHINLGDANAISGGLNVNASKNIHNEDHSIHNITNTTSTVNHITQVAAQKTEMELLQERKTLYLNACRRAYEDNVLEQDEMIELDRYRMELGIDQATAEKILDQVRQLVMRHAQKTELTGIAKIKLKQLSEALKKNEIAALIRQIDGLEALAGKFANEELQRKYYLVLAALKHEMCIQKMETSRIDNYWQSFWTCLAYQKAGCTAKSEELLFALSDKFPQYPEDNATLLAVACACMREEREEAAELLQELSGEYTPALQRFVESIYLLLDPKTAQDMGATEQGCAFYLANFFGRNFAAEEDARRKAEEKEARQAQEEQNCKSAVDEETRLKKQWEAMAFRAMEFVVNFDGQNYEELIYNVLDHAIPPALANVPFALFVVSQLFDVVGEEELANEWADKLMALDAQNADAEVMFFKGYVYSEGIGRYEENQEYAMAFFKAAAALGHMDAMGNIAEMYYEGEKVERNDTLALSWAKMLYDSQHPFGLYIYGRAYYEGHGLAKNKKLGEQLLKKVAEMKHTNSLGVFSAQNFINENLSCD